MKIFKNVITICLLALFTISCKNEAKPEIKTIEVEATAESTKLDPNATYAKAEFTIDGMTCQIGCAATIQKKLEKMEGVKSAVVDFDKRLAMVEYDEAKVTPNSLESIVTKVADIYKVSDMKTVNEFSTKKNCSAECKKTCSKEGVTEAEKLACKKECAKKGNKSCKGGVKEGKEMACKTDCKKACCDKKEA